MKIFSPTHCSLVIILACSSCAKKEPEVAPIPATTNQNAKPRPIQQAVKPKVDDDLELAAQLRDPSEMLTLDGTERNKTAQPDLTNKNNATNSPAVVEIPQPNAPVPPPPVTDVKLPVINENTPDKSLNAPR